jgi:hypothetical protein
LEVISIDKQEPDRAESDDYYVEVGFDQQISNYSPGKVLLSLILEELHSENNPDTLNFVLETAFIRGDSVTASGAMLPVRSCAGRSGTYS